MEPFLGEIKMVGFNFAPRGYALCAGQTMQISQNSALFSLLGTMYGGNGQTTFGLPDYRGRAPVGMGQGPGLPMVTQGEMTGVNNVTLLITNMPAHNHVAVYSNPAVNATGTLNIPATTTQGSGSITPANNLILGPSNDPTAGAEVKVYSSAAANTTLAPIPISATGTAPTPTIGTSGSGMPFSVTNPYLGTNFIIALAGVYPSRD